MANNFYKPQSPLELDGNYIYPLTYHDQVILPDGARWDGKINVSPADIGAAPVNHTHPQYFETAKIVFSEVEPAGSQGMIWFKPAE